MTTNAVIWLFTLLVSSSGSWKLCLVHSTTLHTWQVSLRCLRPYLNGWRRNANRRYWMETMLSYEYRNLNIYSYSLDVRYPTCMKKANKFEIPLNFVKHLLVKKHCSNLIWMKRLYQRFAESSMFSLSTPVSFDKEIGKLVCVCVWESPCGENFHYKKRN